MDVFGSIRACGGSNLDLLRDAGPFFHDAIVKIDEVKRFWPAQSVERPVLSAKASKQVVRGMDYAEVDAPLVRIALAGLRKKEFRNATDADRALAGRAEGAGNEESRMKRLLGRIKDLFSPIQPLNRTERTERPASAHYPPRAATVRDHP